MEPWCGSQLDIEVYAVARCGMKKPEGIRGGFYLQETFAKPVESIQLY
jgi:hypothetical protein